MGSQIAVEFVWAATTDTIETYEHRETLRYIHIDGVTGDFLNQQREIISRESALDHARQPAMARVVQVPQPQPIFEWFRQGPEPLPEGTEPVREVTEPETQVTESMTKVTESATQVTESATQVTESAPQGTELVTQVVEPAAQFAGPVALVGEPVREPALNAFTRKHDLDLTFGSRGVFASGLEAVQNGVSISLGMAAEMRRKVLAKASAWAAHPFSGNQSESDGNSSAPDAQEPNFSMFTRRTSFL